MPPIQTKLSLEDARISDESALPSGIQQRKSGRNTSASTDSDESSSTMSPEPQSPTDETRVLTQQNCEKPPIHTGRRPSVEAKQVSPASPVSVEKQYQLGSKPLICGVKVGRRGGFKAAADQRRFSISSLPSVHTRRLSTTTGTLFPKGELELNAFVDYLLSETSGVDQPVAPSAEQLARRRTSTPAAIGGGSNAGRRNSIASGTPAAAFGKGGYGDKFTEHWDWPLPSPIKLTNNDNGFEAIFDVRPFTADEVEAHVVCTDLNISLIKNQNSTDDASRWRRNLSLDRTYHLPLNVDPKTVKFFLNEDQGKIKVTANVIPPLVMHVAAFADMADIQTLKSGLTVENLIKLRRMRDAGSSAEELEDYLKQLLEEIKQRESNA